MSGGKIFVDMVVGLPRLLPFEQAHSLVDEIERRVRSVRGDIDVVVHAEPVATNKESIIDKVMFAAEKVEGKVHEVEVFSTERGFLVDLHLEVRNAETIEAAHAKADALENEIRSQIENVDQIYVHIDKPFAGPIEASSLSYLSSELPSRLLRFVKSKRGVISCRDVSLIESQSGTRVAMICQLDETFSLEETVKMVNELEESIIKEFPQTSKVVIHQEPVQHDIR